MIFAAVCAALGVTPVQLLALMDNAQFPAPTDIGVSYNILFDADGVAAFQALMAAAASNGWIVTDDQLSTADWAMMAATPVGQFYEVAGGDPLDIVD